MPSLLDVTPLSKKVALGANGVEFEFYGVPMREIVVLLKRWPAIAKLLTPSTRSSVDIAAVVDMVPEFAAAAIAASLRMTSPEEEQAILGWGGADTAKAFAAFAELSLPPGMSGPFVEVLAGNPGALLGRLGARSTPAPDTN